MERMTVTLDEELLAEIDHIVTARGYQNRSEAIRDLTRSGLRQAAERRQDMRDCVAALVYVYDHEARELAKRLTKAFHEHHDLSLAAMHVHLDHESCLEIAVLRGRAHAAQRLADRVIAERGVRHGQLVMVPVDITQQKHSHRGKAKHPHVHLHVREAG